jgi:hypothetical protein
LLRLGRFRVRGQCGSHVARLLITEVLRCSKRFSIKVRHQNKQQFLHQPSPHPRTRPISTCDLRDRNLYISLLNFRDYVLFRPSRKPATRSLRAFFVMLIKLIKVIDKRSDFQSLRSKRGIVLLYQSFSHRCLRRLSVITSFLALSARRN